ncbi:MAG TPA: serine/threonine-protein kinase [Kofleriaceae bacterium]|nr:serine/threonine-protein kinase [Kofleriaceae bacterium]
MTTELDTDGVTVDATGSTEDGRSGAMLDARPAADVARVELARERSREALFRIAQPARVGRFVLLDSIGRGAMGVVYAAYDPQLDRKVALKLLSARAGASTAARERMLVEARALARLRHPHVVAVHDVVTVDDQLVIVMELVDGQTLAAWTTSGVRSWREIVVHYAQAARGLHAAHTLGIVHRDFKPANAIVGDDGRVRVLDFGLASAGAGAAAAGEGGEGPSNLASNLTETGAIVGTPAYMAPEQLGGAPASAITDQWSFCTSLHEAVYGVRPFLAETPAQLLAEIRAGNVQRGDRERTVPAWLRAVIDRGLAPRPGDRHASLAALAHELEREHGFRRWRWPALTATAVAAAAALALTRDSSSTSAAVEPCDGGATELAAVWSPTRAETLAKRFAAGSPYAREVGERVRGTIDARSKAWSDIHLHACQAHRRGGSTVATYDRQLACLSRRLGEQRAALDVIERSDDATLPSAIDVVARMPPVAWCDDPEILAAAAEPPAEPARREAVAAISAQLDQAAALERAGNLDEAAALAAKALAAAEPLAYSPAIVESALAAGRIAIARIARGQGELEAALRPLGRAEEVALSEGDLASAVEASARRLFVEGQLGRDLSARDREIAVVEALSRTPRCATFARPLLLNNLGVASMSRGQRDEAVRWFRGAHDALRDVKLPDIELAVIPSNLALVVAQPAERAALAGEAHALLARVLGPNHPSTLNVLSLRAHLTDDVTAATAFARDACDAYATYHATDEQARFSCAQQLAELHVAQGQTDAATRQLQILGGLLDATDPDIRVAARVGTAQLAAFEGDDARAFREATAGLSEAATLGHWWLAGVEGDLHILAARAASRLRRAPLAREHARAAVARYSDIAARNELAEYRRGLTRARDLLAELDVDVTRPGD